MREEGRSWFRLFSEKKSQSFWTKSAMVEHKCPVCKCKAENCKCSHICGACLKAGKYAEGAAGVCDCCQKAKKPKSRRRPTNKVVWILISSSSISIHSNWSIVKSAASDIPCLGRVTAVADHCSPPPPAWTSSWRSSGWWRGCSWSLSCAQPRVAQCLVRPDTCPEAEEDQRISQTATSKTSKKHRNIETSKLWWNHWTLKP